MTDISPILSLSNIYKNKIKTSFQIGKLCLGHFCDSFWKFLNILNIMGHLWGFRTVQDCYDSSLFRDYYRSCQVIPMNLRSFKPSTYRLIKFFYVIGHWHFEDY